MELDFLAGRVFLRLSFGKPTENLVRKKPSPLIRKRERRRRGDILENPLPNLSYELILVLLPFFVYVLHRARSVIETDSLALL